MSEEEKKAIELLKDFKRELNNIESYERADVEGKYKKILIVLQEDDFDTFQTILNLIEKQQKEIEELHKEINQRIKLKIENEKCADRDFIYKGKIREKIKEAKVINWHTPKLVIEYFEELLEEK